MSQETPLTISVPEAGKRYFGLSRNGSYDAAERGEIPTIKVGRLLRVPVRLMERMLDRAAMGRRLDSRQKMRGHEGPGKFDEELLQCEM